MVVKETEIRSQSVIDIMHQVYGFNNLNNIEDSTKQKVSGNLTDNGKKLSLKLNINTLSSEDTATIFLLDYNLVDYTNKLVNKSALTDLIIRVGRPPTTKYNDIDISDVIGLPQASTYSNAYDTINIQLFTYEANVETTYGSKRLSVPYKIDSDRSSVVTTSTDGLYTINFATVRLWNSTSAYVPGQVVVYNSEAYTCKSINIDSTPSENELWSKTSLEDFRKFTKGFTASNESDSLIVLKADMLITRYFKQSLLYDVLSSTGFRSEDNNESFSILQSMRKYRTLALLYLEQGEGINALYSIETAKAKYKDFRDGKFSVPPPIDINSYVL